MSNTRAQLGPSIYQAQFCAYVPICSLEFLTVFSRGQYHVDLIVYIHGETNSQRRQVALTVTYLNPGRLSQNMPLLSALLSTRVRVVLMPVPNMHVADTLDLS